MPKTPKPDSTASPSTNASGAGHRDAAPPSPAGDAVSWLTEDDLYLFGEGSHLRLYEKLGAHPTTLGGRSGTRFAVWAPNAQRVAVMGDFNGWSKDAHPLAPIGQAGIWEGFTPGVEVGAEYKFYIVSRHHGYAADKTDPFAFRAEVAPHTASIVWDLAYDWKDSDWMRTRGPRHTLSAPINAYEVHLGSWRRPWDEDRFLSYRELAQPLADYAKQLGFTHVELLPVMEHPFYGSWGYQTTGYFAPTSRYGTPQDLMYLIDVLHQHGVGVLLDWVPSHFPSDEHGLGYFDGTHLFEHADPRQGFHPDWLSLIFNYGRDEVRSFLLSSAHFWLDRYHADGLRVDAVASMLQLDYSRNAGDWIPNRYGGRENLEAIAFLRRLNEEVYARFPDIITTAEESTAWPMVSRPTYLGGLGFGLKWDMGWMNDTLKYLQADPIYRRYEHQKLTFRMLYAFSENFLLPLSHDEVVHGKRSLAGKMPGDDWQKLANLRLLLAYQIGQPGKKLLFMGGELGQWREWSHDTALDWDLLSDPRHRGIQKWVEDINRLYCERPALHEYDCDPRGFEWIDANDSDHSVASFLRRGHEQDEVVLAVFNFTPVPRYGYRLGVPAGGFWEELANSDAADYGGSGQGNLGGVEAKELASHGRPFSVSLTLPPLSALFFAPRSPQAEEEEEFAEAAEPSDPGSDQGP
jgi:1,4-alpha-glucan branching enzyme